jgi:hypothetical protein
MARDQVLLNRAMKETVFSGSFKTGESCFDHVAIDLVDMRVGFDRLAKRLRGCPVSCCW